MKNSDLYKSFEGIDDDILMRSEMASKSRRKPVFAILSAAAGILLIAGAVFAGIKLLKPAGTKQQAETDVSSQAASQEDGVTIPQTEVSLKTESSAEADMIGFFIYEGRMYVQYGDWIREKLDIIGERLGTATGLVNEWTPKDGYVDFAGSVRGDFYAVKDYDPSFMLCMKDPSGAVSLFVCNSGITMKYGSELFTDRLHLQNYTDVLYETRDSWFRSKEELYRFKDRDAINEFITEINAAEFMLCADIPFGSQGEVISSLEEYHLYFRMENGITIHLRLLKGGYIVFDGLMDACVRIPEESYNRLISMLNDRSASERAEMSENATMIEDCRNDPELGRYLPSYTPENQIFQFAEIQYYIDPETAAETGTKEIHVEYSAKDPRIYYAVTVTWASEYGKNGWAGPMQDLSELSLDTLSPHVQTENARGEALDYERIDVGVWIQDASVVVSARGLPKEEVYQILSSIAEE